MKLDSMILIVIAITCITTLEVIALANGFNGICLSASVAAIAAVVTGTPLYLWGKVRNKTTIKNEVKSEIIPEVKENVTDLVITKLIELIKDKLK